MSIPNRSKNRLTFAAVVLAASGTWLLASAAPPQTPMPLKGAVPPGTILPFAGATVPMGYLLCDGTEVQRSAYPGLFDAIGPSWGAATAFTFTLPDLRGRFLRGVDGAATNDPDRNSRVAIAPGGNVGNNPGSLQGDARRGHSGTVSGTTDTAGNHAHAILTNNDNYDEDDGSSTDHAPGWADDKPPGDSTSENDTAFGGNHQHSFTATVDLPGDAETRPKNVYVNFIIKL